MALVWGLMATPAVALTNGLALKPPMGWNTWYKFLGNYNEMVLRQTADALVTNGLAAAGYEYLNLDDCWFAGRDAQGRLLADPAKFPSGIQSTIDYVHGRGLKFGLYLCAANCGYCSAYTPVGHETNDAIELAGWGVDFVKIDSANQRESVISQFQAAFAATGRPIVISLSDAYYESWMPRLANTWRISADEEVESWSSVMRVLDNDNACAGAAGPGHWNDADMLQIGILNLMSDTEYKSHFGLWCLIASPLLLGCDVRSIDPAMQAILTAPEVIAINQDPAGIQGTRISSSPGQGGNLEVWCKPLGYDGCHKAVALFNRGTNTANVSVNWTNVLLRPGPASVRDLWTRTDLGVFTNGYTASVAPHQAVLVEIVGTSLISVPRITSLENLGTKIVVRGTNGSTNAQVNLLSSSDPQKPLPLWTIVATNQCDRNGSFCLTNRIEPQPQRSFFRVRFP